MGGIAPLLLGGIDATAYKRSFWDSGALFMIYSKCSAFSETLNLQETSGPKASYKLLPPFLTYSGRNTYHTSRQIRRIKQRCTIDVKTSKMKYRYDVCVWLVGNALSDVLKGIRTLCILCMIIVTQPTVSTH